MTIEEYNALDECEKEDWKHYCEDCVAEWEKERQTLALPYPDNFLRFVYGEFYMLSGNYQSAAEELICNLPCSGLVHSVFQKRQSFKDVAKESGVIEFTVYNWIVKAGRLMRHPSRRKKLNGLIEFVGPIKMTII